MSAYRYPTVKEIQTIRALMPDKVPQTGGQCFLQLVATVTLAASALYIWLYWPSLPQHYDFLGRVTSYGDKHILLFLLFCASVIYLAFLIVPFSPRPGRSTAI